MTTRAGEPLTAAAEDVVRALRSRHLGRFALLDAATAPPDADALHPTVVGNWWWGADGARIAVRFTATVPEWSVESAGWITSLVAGELAARGVSVARVTVERR